VNTTVFDCWVPRGTHTYFPLKNVASPRFTIVNWSIILYHIALRLFIFFQPCILKWNRSAWRMRNFWCCRVYGSEHLEQNFFFFFPSKQLWVPRGTQKFRNPARSKDRRLQHCVHTQLHTQSHMAAPSLSLRWPCLRALSKGIAEAAGRLPIWWSVTAVLFFSTPLHLV
jgi:hypothetical protein